MEVIFDFKETTGVADWVIVNDAVMGGKSAGSFSLTEDGFGLFQGELSLENNGGFSSVRCQFKPLKVKQYESIFIKLKGKPTSFQFRIKDDLNNNHSYVKLFHTSGEWQDIEISLKDMLPKFRGTKLDLPAFSGDFIEQIGFLIANKKSEKFELLIERIELR
ncbi:CIA30 family protein [Mariniflexile sp.]|uniref:CIA30 family protein n=1 Tax=Mariniflexile sp. TaxID=1979402 RepID=UPI003569B075